MKTTLLACCGAALCLAAGPARAAEGGKADYAAALKMSPYQQAAAQCSRQVFPAPRGDDTPATRAAYGKWTAESRAAYESCMQRQGLTDADAVAYLKTLPYKTKNPDQRDMALQQGMAGRAALPPAAAQPQVQSQPLPQYQAASPPPAQPGADVPVQEPQVPAAPAAAVRTQTPLYVVPRTNGAGGSTGPKPIYLPGAR